MIIESGLIQNFLLAASFAALFAAITFMFMRVFKKEDKPDKTDIKPTEKQSLSTYKKVLSTAHKHAKTLLFDTTVEAVNIIAGTKQTNEHMEEQLDKVLQSVAVKEIHTLKTSTDSYENDYQKQLQTIQEQMHQQTQEAIENTKKSYEEKLDKFTNELLRNGLSTQELVDKKTSELLSVAEKEVAEYKKNQLAKIDDEVKKMLEKVYRDVLRISIPENIHQDLIIKSLEEAKRDGLFKL